MGTGQRRDLIWGSGSVHAGIIHALANEHLTATWAYNLFLRGCLRKENFPLQAWMLNDFAAAFTAVASGQAFKAVLIIG